jgi:shikimate dehydrogenase
VLGWPLLYTLSPAIHSAGFKALGLDWTYLAWPVPPEDLGAALAGLRVLGCAGANITMPHKESALRHLDELSPEAQAVGAVNTIEFRPRWLVGHNTDVTGFSQFLSSDAGVGAPGKRALVLGAGGAARAVVKALDDLGAARIEIAARRAEVAGALTALATEGRGAALRWSDAPGAATEADIVVNATPLGAGGEAVLEEVEWRPGQVVVDLVYDPPSTPLVDAARARGADAWGGVGMLVHQAAGSLRLWTGMEPPLEVMSAAAVRALRRRRPGERRPLRSQPAEDR